MEMHQIRYFLAVADWLNFTRAAEHCNVTQPALTRAIQKLEEEVGGLLFRRERNMTHLTDLGHLLRPHLEQILRESDAVRTTAKSFLKLDDAPLSLGVMCTIGPLRFIGFLRDFNAKFPGIEVSLLETTPAQLTALLLEEKLDTAVAAQPGPFDERLRVQPLYRERFMVAFPAGHRFEKQATVRLAEVAGESYLSRANCEYQDHLRLLRDKCGAEVRRVYRSERDDWIQSMIAGGLGFTFLPEFSPLVPGVMVRPIVEPGIEREVSLLTVAGRRHMPALASFVRAIQGFRWPEASVVKAA